MNKLDKEYTDLLQDILDNGIKKEDRTGTGTISVFGRQIRHKMSDGFPLITTKKMYMKGIITELIWFLRGGTNIKYLVDNDCHIWDGDCFANYVRNFTKYVDSLPEDSETEFIINKDKFINKIKTDDEFAKKWGDLGPIYGKQWRSWETMEGMKVEGNGYTESMVLGWKLRQDEHGNITDGRIPIDQIANSINLLKTDPDSRRMVVSAWAVHDLPNMVLPPCHYGFQVYTRELSDGERVMYYETKLGRLHFVPPTKQLLDKENIPTRAISLMFNMRSNDVPLGLPFNIASYGLLLEIIAKAVNMIPDELIGNLGDAHIYLNQIDGVKEQIRRDPYPLPTLKINSGNENWHLLTIDEIINSLDVDITFKVDGYQSHPSIKMPLSN